MSFSPHIVLALAEERQREALRRADAARLAREAKRSRNGAPLRPSDDVHVTLRLDVVGDASRLHQLAALSERPLVPGPFVVAEVDGDLVAALPVAGGAPFADPFARTAHLRPLLELRAAQIRRVDDWSSEKRRLLPRLSRDTAW
jgi:hypothetical protein